MNPALVDLLVQLEYLERWEDPDRLGLLVHLDFVDLLVLKDNPADLENKVHRDHWDLTGHLVHLENEVQLDPVVYPDH